MGKPLTQEQKDKMKAAREAKAAANKAAKENGTAAPALTVLKPKAPTAALAKVRIPKGTPLNGIVDAINSAVAGTPHEGKVTRVSGLLKLW